MTVKNYDCRDLETIFAATFSSFNTRLQGGAPEPLYSPSSNKQTQHVIYYREDYFSSALHEVSHWVIAGEERRQLEDYGYWYNEDGRSSAQQQEFEKVEVLPQAIELAFNRAIGRDFDVSVDNLNGDVGDIDSFRKQVALKNHALEAGEMPLRASMFISALVRAFKSEHSHLSEQQSLEPKIDV